MSVSIFIVDDSDAIRTALKALLGKEPDFRVIGEAADGDTAVHSVIESKPDVVLVDIGLPKRNGIDVTRKIKSETRCKAVVFTSHDDDHDMFEAFNAGADAYIVKQSFDPARLKNAIATVASGKCWLDPSIAKRVLQFSQSHAVPFVDNETLTLEETTVLQQAVGETHVCQGGVCDVNPDFLRKLNRFSKPQRMPAT